ncbi:MAG: hypothetical protein J7M10_01845 [Candidatus Cloacimonetes bacterium]|nr:hypothetical protein [Candidatus Cloacimonadota bacterium]
MIKKIAILVILMTMFIGGNLLAQSVDVYVHGVLKSGSTLFLYRQDIPGEPQYLCRSKTPEQGSGYYTESFLDITCSELYPIWTLTAVQGNRSDTESGGISPFTTVHLYLPTTAEDPDPGEPEPPNE